MNHEATRLTEHLTALRKASQEVVDSLTQLKAENQVKREREEKKKQEEMKIINESVLQVQQELEVCTIETASSSFVSHRLILMCRKGKG